MDEKDDLLLKAQKVTNYLRDEKEKLISEFQEKEKFYREHIQHLEKVRSLIIISFFLICSKKINIYEYVCCFIGVGRYETM